MPPVPDNAPTERFTVDVSSYPDEVPTKTKAATPAPPRTDRPRRSTKKRKRASPIAVLSDAEVIPAPAAAPAPVIDGAPIMGENILDRPSPPSRKERRKRKKATTPSRSRVPDLAGVTSFSDAVDRLRHIAARERARRESAGHVRLSVDIVRSVESQLASVAKTALNAGLDLLSSDENHSEGSGKFFSYSRMRRRSLTAFCSLARLSSAVRSRVRSTAVSGFSWTILDFS